MAYAVQVMVVDRRTGKGLSGQRVKAYGGPEVKTNSSGLATVIVSSSAVDVYVNGMRAYNGSVSAAPKPIIYERG
ncbi:hypothetical protein ACM66Z_07100 [Sulfurovum sp. ST-21]|uniref:Uncharacterized protein n=1 Tax=Sulfurovum indicum TaxID=2779528 RepID=A0A7M1S3B5_9BACT|nr:hypothetical protein [Sulfurovum indicum]QOR61219.1 hypothetical protein IMZ28_07095 [Sulfurovum indicum]